MIDFTLTDEQRHIQQEVAQFAARELREQHRLAEEEGVPATLRTAFHRLGVSILEIPEELEGVGLDNLSRAVVAEELACGDAGIALALEGPGAAGLALQELGREEQRRRWLPRFASDPLACAALALWEDDRSSLLGNVKATWRPTSAGVQLSGTKRFVLHAGESGLQFYVVSARLEGCAGNPSEALPPSDLRLFLVPPDAPGLSVEPAGHRLGLRTCPLGKVTLAGVELAPDSLLDGAADLAAAYQRLLSRQRVWDAARALGLARAAVTAAAGYAQERQAFGRKIGQFQSIAFMIADNAIRLDSARWLVWQAACLLDAGRPAVKEAALAALQAHETAVQATIDHVQVMGGQGFMKDFPAEKWMRDARTLFNLAGGAALLNLAAANGDAGLAAAGQEV